LRLPTAIALLFPQKARAEDDWDDVFDKINFEPTTHSILNKTTRRLRTVVGQCSDGFEVCKGHCDSDEKACLAKGKKAKLDSAPAACNTYKLTSCHDLCSRELGICSGKRMLPEE
jgi:hypothetical protein